MRYKSSCVVMGEGRPFPGFELMVLFPDFFDSFSNEVAFRV